MVETESRRVCGERKTGNGQLRHNTNVNNDWHGVETTSIDTVTYQPKMDVFKLVGWVFLLRKGSPTLPGHLRRSGVCVKQLFLPPLPADAVRLHAVRGAG
jgi:hypothetical protein